MFGRCSRVAACLVALLGATGCSTELAVVSSGGFAAAYRELAPGFSETTGVELTTAYGASMGGAADSIPARLGRGEVFDVVILSRAGLDELVATGLVVAASGVDLAESVIGMAVPADQPAPDISSIDAFRQTLLDASSIAYSASVSGTYLSTEVFPRLGLVDALAGKSTRVVSERVGTVVARGDAAVGFQQVSELLPIDGIRYVGEIPAALQKVTVFAAGVTTNALQPELAADLIAYLTSSAVAPTVRETGLRPLSPR